MAFYEQTIVAKQDLPGDELKKIEDKYKQIIEKNSGKILKTEKWGLINFATRIDNYNKGYYIHIKFEGNSSTLDEINNKIKIDRSVLRNLLVRYKKLNLEKEYFNKDYKNEKEK